MLELSRTEIERYLKSVIGPSARIVNLKVLGGSEEKDIKSYGYGTPVQIDYGSVAGEPGNWGATDC
jgi:hypothetical protein